MLFASPPSRSIRPSRGGSRIRPREFREKFPQPSQREGNSALCLSPFSEVGSTQQWCNHETGLQKLLKTSQARPGSAPSVLTRFRVAISPGIAYGGLQAGAVDGKPGGYNLIPLLCNDCIPGNSFKHCSQCVLRVHPRFPHLQKTKRPRSRLHVPQASGRLPVSCRRSAAT